MGVDELVQAYLDAWAATDDETRRAALETCWSDDGVYQDPTAKVEGREAFATHLTGFHDRLPGTHFELGSRVDAYDRWFRFAWRLLKDEDGSEALQGLDIGRLGDDGRIAAITGFFGPLT